MSAIGPVSQRWDAEYRDGRYADEPPLPFVGTILSTLHDHPAVCGGVGLYVGCGNGRNFGALADAGLTLWGVDISPEALAQLAARRPACAPRLACQDVLAFQPDAPFDYLVAIQVFQHGREAEVAAYFDRAAALLAPGGLLFLRVNAASTEVYHRHRVVERNRFGGFTVEYEEGPKRGLPVHFFARDELHALTSDRFRVVRELAEAVTRRVPPMTGRWSQWEAAWSREG
jgi:SAM-dependent methyltransferase